MPECLNSFIYSFIHSNADAVAVREDIARGLVGWAQGLETALAWAKGL
jgi:hypothetical protein